MLPLEEYNAADKEKLEELHVFATLDALHEDLRMFAHKEPIELNASGLYESLWLLCLLLFLRNVIQEERCSVF